MNEFGTPSTEALLARINALLEELASMGSGLSDVAHGLQSTLPHLLAEVSTNQAMSEEHEHALLSSLEGRVKTALRARRATHDLRQLLVVHDPVEALYLVRGWYPTRGAATAVPERLRPVGRDRWEDLSPLPYFPGFGDDDVYFTTGLSYIASAQAGEVDEVWIAVRKLLTVAGYEVLHEGREEPGSVWKHWTLKGSKKAAKNLTEGVGAAVNDSYVRRPGAQATLDFAKAAAELIKAMGNREGVHRLDNLVVVQLRGSDGELRSISKELNPLERQALESNPSLLDEPAKLMTRLHEIQNASPPTESGQ